ncbi:enoyl-CoA hydratase-related protein [Nocardioides endophyticus]|uniref:Enoyl-CoA hydratase-related protein n=1 Tax=Nocardioides endophyticus TaxID=1353775 RepID=A0ABP8YH31_9ACTN
MDEVDWQHRDGYAKLVLNRPERKNAIDTATWHRLQKTLDAIAEDTTVNAVVITGAGANFSAGADISGGSSSHRTQLERMEWFNKVILALHRLPIPTIAQVDGVAFGVGMNLAIGCDFVIASDRARFSEVFVKRALSVDGGGSWMLPRLVGVRRAKLLCLLADTISADEALDMGLLTKVVDAEELDAEVDKLAARLVASPRLALVQTKRLIDEGLTLTLEQAMENEARAQALNVASDDFSAAMAAFRGGPRLPAEPAESGDRNG